MRNREGIPRQYTAVMINHDTKTIIEKLRVLANEETVTRKAEKFGIKASNSLGLYQKDIAKVAKETGKNSVLADALFESGIYKARLLCSKIFAIKDLTEEHLEKWVVTFENWEICDSFCMGLVAKSPYAVSKALEWTGREREFEKRAGFATIAAYCMADKKASNDVFKSFFPPILKGSTDDRIYVKKAVMGTEEHRQAQPGSAHGSHSSGTRNPAAGNQDFSLDRQGCTPGAEQGWLAYPGLSPRNLPQLTPTGPGN